MESCYENVIVSSAEFVKDRLYFVSLNTIDLPKSTQNTHYFSIDGRLSYENFFDDFGPLNISMLYHYCLKLNKKLENIHTGKIVHIVSSNPQKRVNSAYLIGSYAIIYLGFDAQKAYDTLTANNKTPFINFRDASNGQEGYTITLLNCLKGLHKAFHFGFFNFSSFNSVHYEHYERVENGDLNWIVPGKFLGFCGPHHKSANVCGYPLHSPEFYFKYFQRNGVTTIIRLNKRIYDSNKFVNAGFQHHDLYFVDGSTPTDKILAEFLNICEKADGAIAVHCKAGLGRTGTLIACYLMKHYHFTAHEAIGWIRICRPGSVIGHQQEWLERKQEQMWKDGEAYRKKKGIMVIPKHKFGIYCKRTPGESTTNIINPKINDKVRGILKKVDTMQLNDVEKESADDGITQGDKLNQIKAKRQCQAAVTAEKTQNKPQVLTCTLETTSPIVKVSKVFASASKTTSTSNSRVLFRRSEAAEQQQQRQQQQTTPRRVSQRNAALRVSPVAVVCNGKSKVTPKKSENGWIIEERTVTAIEGREKTVEKMSVVKQRGKRTLAAEKDKAINPRSVKILRRSDVDIKTATKLHLPLVKPAK